MSKSLHAIRKHISPLQHKLQLIYNSQEAQGINKINQLPLICNQCPDENIGNCNSEYMEMLFLLMDELAKVHDVYTLVRMVRTDLYNIRIFYGGKAHYRHLLKLMTHYLGFTNFRSDGMPQIGPTAPPPRRPLPEAISPPYPLLKQMKQLYKLELRLNMIRQQRRTDRLATLLSGSYIVTFSYGFSSEMVQ